MILLTAHHHVISGCHNWQIIAENRAIISFTSVYTYNIADVDALSRLPSDNTQSQSLSGLLRQLHIDCSEVDPVRSVNDQLHLWQCLAQRLGGGGVSDVFEMSAVHFEDLVTGTQTVVLISDAAGVDLHDDDTVLQNGDYSGSLERFEWFYRDRSVFTTDEEDAQVFVVGRDFDGDVFAGSYGTGCEIYSWF